MSTSKFIFLPIIEEKNELIVKNPYIETIKEYLEMKRIKYEINQNNLIINKNSLCTNDIDKIDILIRLKRDEILQRSILKNYA